MMQPLPFPRPTSINGALAGLSLAVLLASLGTSIANVALPTLAEAFAAPFQQVQWVVLAYLLAITTLIVGVGRLADLSGRRRLLLGGIALFTLASALGAAAPALAPLVAIRAVQGLGAAVMMALGLAFVGDILPKDKTGSAMGLLGTMSAMGTALGPSLGGGLISAFGWPAIFLVNLPLGVVAFVLCYRHLPAIAAKAESGHPAFDHAGMVLLALTLAAYALAMTMGGGRFGPLNLALLAAALVGAGLFVMVERRTASPLIRLTLFGEAGLRTGFATSALVATVIMTTLVVGPFYLSRTLGLGPAMVGLAMTAGPLVAALTGMPAGRLVDRVGTHRASLAGLGAMITGTAALAVIPSNLGLLGYIAPLVMVTAGYALFQTANNTGIMSQGGSEQRGVISALLNLSRNLGLISGASVMGAVFALAWAGTDMAQATPDAVATGMRTTFAVAAIVIVAALALTVGWKRAD
ncbi:MFS transporter [Magnetospirillum gryphiswaldense]|nr:MFS transporter [Magnetospirillum gryphiswaldense]